MNNLYIAPNLQCLLGRIRPRRPHGVRREGDGRRGEEAQKGLQHQAQLGLNPALQGNTHLFQQLPKSVDVC